MQEIRSALTRRKNNLGSVKKDQNFRQKKLNDKKRVELGPIQLNQEIKEYRSTEEEKS